MAQNRLLLILRILAFLLLGLLLLQLGLIYDTQVFNIFNILTIVGDLRDVFAYVFYIILFGIFTGIFMLMGTIFQMFGNIFSASFFYNFAQSVFSNMIGNWFYLPDYSPEAGESANLIAPSLNESFEGLKFLFTTITEDVYLIILQFFILMMFFYALRGTFTSNPGDSIKVITYINIVIVIPLFFFQIDLVLSMFANFIPSMPTWYTEIINKGLIKPEIFQDIREWGFIEFITSEIFLVAVTMFVYLEFVFQLAYVDQVTMPSIEREQRLSRQIDVMHIEAEKAIARIKAMEEMKREKKAQERAARTEADKDREREEKEKFSLEAMMSESSENIGFTYVAELIAKKKAEKAEQIVLDAMRDTRKVANYLDKLFKQDREAKETLTAKTSAPKSSKLVISTIRNILTRFVIITCLTWICVHPYQVFSFLRAPEAILNSVELQTVESVLSLLLPILLVIPMISSVIKMTKHNKLQEMLRLEELKRSGLTEEELQALESQRTDISADEVKMTQDKDAAADRARKNQQQA